MEQSKISHTQLAALIWAGVLAPAVELLPSLTLTLAGKGAWLAPVAALPPVLLSGWLLGRVAGERGLSDAVRGRLGPAAGTAVLLIYVVWGEILLSLRLRLCAQRLMNAGQRDGTLWFFLLGTAVLTAWMGMGRLSAFARAGQFFLTILLLAGAVVLLLSLSRVRPERVLPLWKEDALPVISTALPTAGVLGWGIYGAFLTGETAPPESSGRRYWLFWSVGGCLILSLAQWIVLGNLSPALAARLEDPFFTLAQSVGVEGAFQRVESVAAALWTLADLTMAALLLFALRAMAAAVFPARQERKWAAGGLLLAVVLALAVFRDGAADQWSRGVVPTGNLILGLGVPFFLWLLRERGGTAPDKSISCGEKTE